MFDENCRISIVDRRPDQRGLSYGEDGIGNLKSIDQARPAVFPTSPKETSNNGGFAELIERSPPPAYHGSRLCKVGLVLSK